MPSSFSLRVASATLLTLTGVLLSSCSSPNPTTSEETPAAGVAAQPSPRFPFGGKVASLNGIAGHTFGQPLSAFPKMRLLPPTPDEMARTYAYEGNEGWFGKHHQQVHTQFYYFLNGKFCRFMALGDPTVLRPEVTYLFGPGQAQGRYWLFWEGSQARAAYTERARGMGMEGPRSRAGRSGSSQTQGQKCAVV
jgi:hypothetical protein